MRLPPLLLLGVLLSPSPAALTQARDGLTPGESPGPTHVPRPYVAMPAALQDQRALLITHPGAGAGGADESRMQSLSLGMDTLGFGAQQGLANRVADDFVVPAGGYRLTALTVYSYQTGSTTTPTHNGISLRIWNGPPGAPGAAVVYGDATTNRLSSATFAQIYRTSESTSGNTSRPIMAVTASGLDIELPQGTYWLDFALSGTLGSGPWTPPITVLGSTGLGNGLQSIGGIWSPALDGGTGAVRQGFPLTLDGAPLSTDIALAISDAPDPVLAGDNLSYGVSATNQGPIDAVGITISLPLPAGTSLVSATPGAGGSCSAGNPVTCTFPGSTAVASTATASIVVAVPAALTSGSMLVANASVSSITNDIDPSNNQASASTAVTSAADLSMTLGDSPDPVVAGTLLNYVASAVNVGPSDAQGVTINLPLPAGTALVSANPGNGGVCTAGSCSFAGASAPGTTRSATYVFRVGAAVVSGSSIAASATASSATDDPDDNNNTATSATSVNTSADLSLTLSDSPDPVIAGTPLNYTVTVTNAGPSDAQGVTVSLPAPTGTILISGPTAPIGTLAAGASAQSTYVFAVSPAVLAGSTLAGAATVSATTSDPNTANNSATTTTAVNSLADLAATLTPTASSILVNVPVTFSATSSNHGPSDAHDLVLEISLSPDFRYSGHTASTGAACTTPQVGNSGVISCTWAGATGPNGVRTLDVSAFSNVGNQNTVSVNTRSATQDPVPGNNAAAVSVTVGFLIEEIPSLNALGLLMLGLSMVLVGSIAARRLV